MTCEASRIRGIQGIMNRNAVEFHSLSVEIPDEEDTFILAGESEKQVKSNIKFH